MDGCPFCAIIAGDAPATFVAHTEDCVAFRPLNPVTPGHLLAVPRRHVVNAIADPELTGRVFAFAASLYLAEHNLITSVGKAATQTVPHLHVHLVPRQEGDGLHLPWTGQVEAHR